MIRLVDIEKSLPTKPSPTWLLRRINLEFDRGEFVTIMGPSGACKSTLLAILGMLDADFKGEYWLGDQAVHALKLAPGPIVAQYQRSLSAPLPPDDRN